MGGDFLGVEEVFEEEIKKICLNHKGEYAYTSLKLLEMIEKKGAVNAAKTLIRMDKIPNSISCLYKCHRFNLNVEMLILSDRFKELFTEEDKNICKERLNNFG